MTTKHFQHYPDNFAHKHLPKIEDQPEYLLPDGFPMYGENLNCAHRLLDSHIDNGNGESICLRSVNAVWTYQKLHDVANKIAHHLVNDLKLVPGNRVLLRSANNPMLVACWYGVIKAGGIVVTTMPLLRTKELTTIINCAEISHALCDNRLRDELEATNTQFLKQTSFFDGLEQASFSLEKAIASHSSEFENYKAKPNSVALIGFTSGTTGVPKMTAHYHTDILNICEAFPKYALQPTPEDVFIGSPPIGFTFGLGGLVLFPMYYGASSFMLEKPSPDNVLSAIQNHKVTICFTAPTAWRVIQTKLADYDISSLRKCISAGETLSVQIWEDWYKSTGLKIIDGIGATEMLHIFISSNEDNMKPGATGFAVPGYAAKVVNDAGEEVEPNTIGKLAVKGITGCKYLNRPDKQSDYVQNGWNITGDLFKRDEDGYFWYVARGDDMIISSGYNIAAIEVENVLLSHDNVLECAVTGIPDDERGMLVCAAIVLKNGALANDEYAKGMQDWFKQNAAPYKYPRKICFVDALPKTQTGKVQRFRLKETLIQN